MLNSHAGYVKRATAIGINMTVGNCAGLVIGQIFKNTTSEGRYLVGEVTSLSVSVVSVFLISGLYFYKRRQNRIRDRLSPNERQFWLEQDKTGDAHPDFRYIL